MSRFESHDMFINHNTGELQTFYHLTTYETNENLSKEEIEELEENLLHYFYDLLGEGTFEQVYELCDENGAFLGYQTEEGMRV